MASGYIDFEHFGTTRRGGDIATAPLGPVIAPTALVAVVGSATAVVINLATSDGASIWTWVAVSVMTVLGFLASLWMQHRLQDAALQRGTGDLETLTGGVSRTHRSRLLVIALSLAVLAPFLVYATVVGVRSQAEELPSQLQAMCPRHAPVPGPDGEIRTHEIWASSADNERYPINGYHDWVMTSFPVLIPYLISIDVAAGPNGQRVLITVENAAEDEIAQGEATVDEYRAKYTFAKPVDVSDYMCSDLYLRVRNITDRESHVYLSRIDRDPSVHTYFSDQCRTRTDPALACQSKDRGRQDLSALVAGRASG
jgi:hypothetical protein